MPDERVVVESCDFKDGLPVESYRRLLQLLFAPSSERKGAGSGELGQDHNGEEAA